MLFAPNDIDLYRCQRSTNPITYRVPSTKVPDGNYMLHVLMAEDKWDEYPKSNNGRITTLVVEGVAIDVINAFGRLGLRHAALDLKYCITVSGGFDMELRQTGGPSTYAPSISGFSLTADPTNKCRHSIYERAGTVALCDVGVFLLMMP